MSVVGCATVYKKYNLIGRKLRYKKNTQSIIPLMSISSISTMLLYSIWVRYHAHCRYETSNNGDRAFI